MSAEAVLAEARRAFWVMVTALAAIWGIQVVNALLGYQLSYSFGVQAWNPLSLPEVFTAPFLHYGWDHIEGNSGPLFIFGFLAAFRGVRKFISVTLVIIVVSGLGAWLTSAPGTVTAGASGVVFGYFGYIMVRGLFDRHGIDIVIGLVMALSFAYQFSVIVPGTPGVSWQGHLFGFLAGILGGWVFRERRPKQVDPATPSLDATSL
ncbi:rhomboid family intramembrane serine protease [Kutzneria chonburiensis]|uniref:Rhomboid family intramembrane serine protease n=1 Tax=Kutzneria chonburiensis TaxID=1483604 RepID=A0ABV6MJB7_9PSEU|nr:rhomboid family intramembrane serine protease [Kutzneria chonburiensis]